METTPVLRSVCQRQNRECNRRSISICGTLIIQGLWIGGGVFMTNGDEPTAQHLRQLLVLAEELHFGRAANRLYLSQPALSQRVRALELKLGVQLFDRTSRRVELTAQGQALLPLARRVVDSVDDLLRAAERASNDTPVLRLGVCESFAALDATRGVISMLSTDHPELGPEVRVVDSFTEQLAELRKGEIDAAFVHLPVPDDLGAQPLVTEPRVACIAAHDPLAERDVIRLSDLADHPVLGLNPEGFPEGRRFWAVDPRPDGTRVRHATHKVTGFESLLSTVALGGAIAFVPVTAARLYVRPDVRYLQVADLPECEFGVIWQVAEKDKPHIEVLRSVCHRFTSAHETTMPSLTSA
ncbi:LysR family transcriptional regulator [Saccharothrix sp. Mg75]|uniref:LysR family transcriptional regulator n=1 Tax=Saccharothrix sp. Mg75 TaxID=3445357 RepID=UPI003EEEC50B